VKLVHLVGFITKKFVTMHGHMNVKKKCNSIVRLCSFYQCCISPSQRQSTFSSCF